MCFCLVERHVTIAEYGRAAFFFAGGQLFFRVCVSLTEMAEVGMRAPEGASTARGVKTNFICFVCPDPGFKWLT